VFENDDDFFERENRIECFLLFPNRLNWLFDEVLVDCVCVLSVDFLGVLGSISEKVVSLAKMNYMLSLYVFLIFLLQDLL
jgi:hypothetical protein